MRILHTADWHLCNRLGPINRTADLQARVETLAALCEEHRVDTLLVAGDIFDDRADVEQITTAFNHVLKTFERFLERGGTILAVTGNHDRDAKINIVRTGMQLAAPFARSAEGRIAGGRMYLNNGRGFAALPGPDGRLVQFVFVPYPFPSRYDLGDAAIIAREQLHNELHAKVAEWLQQVHAKPGFDRTLPTVQVAHLHVRGSDIHSVYKMNAADDVQFDFADLNPSWAYVALGHIHKPQMVGGAAHVRYPGSLDRLDITESHEHGAILFEVGPSGLLEDPHFLAIPATPFHAVEIANLAEELPGLAEKYPDRETAIVKVSVLPHASTVSRDEATRHLRKIFPRLQDLIWLKADRADSGDDAPRTIVKESFETTIRDYLESRDEFQKDSDAEKLELRTLAEQFLKDGAE